MTKAFRLNRSAVKDVKKYMELHGAAKRPHWNRDRLAELFDDGTGPASARLRRRDRAA